MDVVTAILLLCNTFAEVKEVADFVDAGLPPMAAAEMVNTNAKDTVCGVVPATVVVGETIRINEKWGAKKVIVLPNGIEQYAFARMKPPTES